MIDATPDKQPKVASVGLPRLRDPGFIDLIDASTAPRRPPRPLLWRLFAFGLALLLVASLSWILYSGNQASSNIRSIAVLPLESLSGDSSQDYFADGMTDELITDLKQISSLRVISRKSIMTINAFANSCPRSRASWT